MSTMTNITLTEYGYRKAKRKWGPKMQKVVVYRMVAADTDSPWKVTQKRIGGRIA